MNDFLGIQEENLFTQPVRTEFPSVSGFADWWGGGRGDCSTPAANVYVPLRSLKWHMHMLAPAHSKSGYAFDVNTCNLLGFCLVRFTGYL